MKYRMNSGIEQIKCYLRLEQALRKYINDYDGKYMTSPKSNIKKKWKYNYHTYKKKHLMKCFFQQA